MTGGTAGQWCGEHDGVGEKRMELPIDMPAWFPETMEQWQAGDWPGKEACVVKEGTFLLGNHADELTVSEVSHGHGRGAGSDERCVAG